MFVGVGTTVYAAGIFHLVTHAFFKALLFLGSGAVIHAMHGAYHHTHSHADAQDMRNMGGLRQWMPVTYRVMWIAWLAIAGIPPLAGFFSKDEILAVAFARGHEAPVWYLIWFLGTAAAFLTAFYMTRLMLYTFEGPNRTGQAEQAHLHEAPKVMTVPLMVLAGLTVAGGLLNLPAFLPGSQWLHHWLEPVLAASAGLPFVSSLHLPEGQTEYLLVGTAVLVGLIGLLAGFRRTLGAPIAVASAAPPERGFARVLFNKYWVDELYQKVVVGPLVWFSRNVLWRFVDNGLIDKVAVDGSAGMARHVLGRAGSLLQSGQVGLYIVFFLVGALWILRVMIG
jgi:NADH-quinone oxidoreductase subunit L